MGNQPRGAGHQMEPFRQILHTLEKHPHIHLAILFGSFAKGTARSDSDIDLAVRADRPLTVEEQINLTGDLAEATGRAVDLIDLFKAGEPLLGQILEGGLRLKGDESEYASLIVKHLFDEADFAPYQRRILEERRRSWIGR